MKIILANPRGFCAGVERAINIVELAIKKFGAPIYVRHEIVHNKDVVRDLRAQGAVFVDEIDEVPAGSVVIFSAHGVSKKVSESPVLEELNLQALDATCPLVTKVHNLVKRQYDVGYKIILIGHKNHPEIVGTAGQVGDDITLVESVNDVANLAFDENTPLAYATQTTLSVNETKHIIQALTDKYPHIVGPNVKDICYATQNRQNAVEKLSNVAGVILVIGAQNSSNSNRLRDLAQSHNVPAYLINNHNDIDLSWFKRAESIGITAGASAPEYLVEETVEFLKKHYDITVENLEGITETVKFKLPPQLIAEAV